MTALQAQPQHHERPCPQCKDRGFYYRLAPRARRFVAAMEDTARAMTRVKCHCGKAEAPTEDSAS